MPPNTTPVRLARDWDAIARDYAAGVLAVSDICALHSVSRRTLYRQAELDGWPLRNFAGLRVRRRSRDGLAKRLLSALDLKMTQFENRMVANASGETAADSERDARTLNTLVRLFDKLKGFGDKAEGGARASDCSAPAGKDAHDADRLRHELAQRVARLRAGIGG